jgi:transposase
MKRKPRIYYSDSRKALMWERSPCRPAEPAPTVYSGQDRRMDGSYPRRGPPRIRALNDCGLIGPGLLAHVLVAKFVDHMPRIAQFSQRFPQRHGLVAILPSKYRE